MYEIQPPSDGAVHTVNSYKISEEGTGTVYDYEANVAYTYTPDGIHYIIDDIRGGCPA